MLSWSKSTQSGPRWLKMAARLPKMALICVAPDTPRCFQDAPKKAVRLSRMLQTHPKMGRNVPTWLQDVPKMGSNGARHAQSKAKMAHNYQCISQDGRSWPQDRGKRRFILVVPAVLSVSQWRCAFVYLLARHTVCAINHSFVRSFVRCRLFLGF